MSVLTKQSKMIDLIIELRSIQREYELTCNASEALEKLKDELENGHGYCAALVKIESIIRLLDDRCNRQVRSAKRIMGQLNME